jgi:hypothetical protein
MAKVQRWRASQPGGVDRAHARPRLRRHAPLRPHLSIPARCCLSGPRLVSEAGTGGHLHGASNLRGRRLHAAGQPWLEARRARPPPPLSAHPQQSQGRRLAGRAPCRPHSPPPHRRPPHRSPSPPTAQPSPPPCGSIPSMAQCACLMLGCPFHLWVWLGASLRQAWLIDPRGPDGLGPAVLLPPTNHPPLSIPNHSNNTTHPSP